jgi:hypothetical protein
MTSKKTGLTGGCRESRPVAERAPSSSETTTGRVASKPPPAAATNEAEAANSKLFLAMLSAFAEATGRYRAISFGRDSWSLSDSF